MQRSKLCPERRSRPVGHKPPVKFEGVGLKLLLEKAGVGFGESLKGKRLASCLVVETADGYRVVIALPELDPAFNEKEVVLTFLRDGKALDDKEGPYRLGDTQREKDGPMGKTGHNLKNC